MVSVLVSEIFGIGIGIGIGFEKNWYRKKYQYWYRKKLVSEKNSDSFSFGFLVSSHTEYADVAQANIFTNNPL